MAPANLRCSMPLGIHAAQRQNFEWPAFWMTPSGTGFGYAAERIAPHPCTAPLWRMLSFFSPHLAGLSAIEAKATERVGLAGVRDRKVRQLERDAQRLGLAIAPASPVAQPGWTSRSMVRSGPSSGTLQSISARSRSNGHLANFDTRYRPFEPPPTWPYLAQVAWPRSEQVGAGLRGTRNGWLTGI